MYLHSLTESRALQELWAQLEHVFNQSHHSDKNHVMFRLFRFGSTW